MTARRLPAAAAAAAAASLAIAVAGPAQALVLGSVTGARAVLSTHVDGFSGATTLGGANHSLAGSSIGSGQPAFASGSASISGSMLRSIAFAETPIPQTPCRVAPCRVTEARSNVAFWDRIDLTFATDEYNDVAMTFKIDGELGQNAGAKARWLFAFSPEYSITGVPYNTLLDGEQTFNLGLRPFGRNVSVYAYMELETWARNGGFADFGHTMRFNWDLPPGTTFTSASGMFSESPAAAVPEPSSWALMILGFGSAGALVRRRRALAAVGTS